jgi:hypothetical protein
MEEVRECNWCEETFTATRVDKTTCSKICSSKYSAFRRGKGKPRVRKATQDNGDMRKCNLCGKWKNRDQEFHKCNGGNVSRCRDCKKEMYKSTKRKEDKKELYQDVKKFVYYMKAKHYYCDGVDVWRLIDMYDRVFPTQLNLPHLSNYNMDMEKSVITMFHKIARWYADERDHLEMKGKLR